LSPADTRYQPLDIRERRLQPVAARVVDLHLGSAMPTHSVTVEIPASPSQVFACLTEPTLLSQWVGGLEASEPLTEGGLRVGARSKETVVEGTRRTEMITEVTALVPERSLRFRIDSQAIRGQSSYELEPSGAGVRLRHQLDVEYRGLLRLLGPLFKPVVQRKLEKDLERLRGLARTLASSPRRTRSS